MLKETILYFTLCHMDWNCVLVPFSCIVQKQKLWLSKCFWTVVSPKQWNWSGFHYGSADPGWLRRNWRLAPCDIPGLTPTLSKHSSLCALYLAHTYINYDQSCLIVASVCGISTINHQYSIKATDARPDVEKMDYCFHNKQTQWLAPAETHSIISSWDMFWCRWPVFGQQGLK